MKVYELIEHKVSNIRQPPCLNHQWTSTYLHKFLLLTPLSIQEMEQGIRCMPTNDGFSHPEPYLGQFLISPSLLQLLRRLSTTRAERQVLLQTLNNLTDKRSSHGEHDQGIVTMLCFFGAILKSCLFPAFKKTRISPAVLELLTYRSQLSDSINSSFLF